MPHLWTSSSHRINSSQRIHCDLRTIVSDWVALRRMEDLERVGKLIALALWALALVAIGILFGGCTSTSSLSRFYFLKVIHPQVGWLLLIYALGKHHKYYAAKGKLRYPITLFIRIHIWLERIQITTGPRPNLPAFYVVGLLGYCQGQTHTTHTPSIANCSDPSIRFSFDLLNALHPVSEEIGNIVPSDGIKALKGYPDFSSWFVLVYFLGAGATLLTMIFGVGSIAFAWKVKLISVITAFVCCKQIFPNSIETDGCAVITDISHARFN